MGFFREIVTFRKENLSFFSVLRRELPRKVLGPPELLTKTDSGTLKKSSLSEAAFPDLKRDPVHSDRDGVHSDREAVLSG